MRSRLQIAVVADDLTGAMDMAAPFAAAGLGTLVRLDAGEAALPPPDVDVLSCSTQSRHAGRDVAAAKVEVAVRSLLRASPAMLLKKIDSTLRGNVAVEIAAALRACERRHVLIAPAAPSQGRTVRGGEVFVHGVPLRASEFAHDGLAPAPAVALSRLLISGCAGLDVRVWARDAAMALAPAEGPHAYIADAETEADLDRIAAFAAAHREVIMIAGATGIGAALARREPQRESVGTGDATSLGPDRNRILFVVGSRTAVSGEQVTRLRATGAQEIVVATAAAEASANALLANGAFPEASSMLVLRADPASRAAPHEVARILARMAADVVRRGRANCLAIVGGDTASAVFAALGSRECSLVGEIMPGIPVGRIVDEKQSIVVVTKSGGFGGPDALVEIGRRLRDR